MPEGTIYHYHEVSGQYLGEGTARLSPAHWRRGIIHYLKPAHTTGVRPNFEVKPPKDIVDFYWIMSDKKWEMRNIKPLARITNQTLVNAMGRQNYLWVHLHHMYHIMYNEQKNHYIIIHNQDTKFLADYFATYEEATTEIEILVGIRKPLDLDKPITAEETAQSQQNWDNYLANERLLIEQYEAQQVAMVAEIEANLAVAREQAQDYQDQYSAIALSEHEQERLYLEEKAALVETTLSNRIEAARQKVLVEEMQRHVDRRTEYFQKYGGR